jgi:signal transduction histidine kinase
MKIRTKLALRFTVIVASILVLFALIIYYFSSVYRQEEFNMRLKRKANNSAKLLIEVKEVGHDLLKIIDKNINSALPEVSVKIFGPDNREIYDNKDTIPFVDNRAIISKVRQGKEIAYKEGHKEGVGVLYRDLSGDYVVLISAYDTFGLSKLENLRYILIFGLLGGVLLAMLMGWIYSAQALRPISVIIEEVKKISAFNLSQRLQVRNRADELGQLAVTFNRMLFRIERAFELQKGFVSNASHELRTPLTAISGQLEIALMKERSGEEYRDILTSVYDDIQKLNRLSNGLIDLAQANIDISKFTLEKIRMDELVWQAVREVGKRHPEYLSNIDIIDLPEEENHLIVMGNEQLLISAIMNLIDNACKFSGNKQVNIELRIIDNSIRLVFTDNGIGISEVDLKNIFQPFYRGVNTKMYAGHGLGLALAQKIIAQHGGSLKVRSVINEFTTIEVNLPSIA